MPQSKPIYYKWAYSPSTGDVTLAHNHEGHPADVRVHEDMEAERPEKDLEFGYAYRQPGGWKLTDHEHKPITDAYEQQKIVETIESVEHA